MPNKSQRTAVYYFAREYAERNSCTIKEAIEQSYPEWKSLTAKEKAPYERQHLTWKEEKKKQTLIKEETKYSIGNNVQEYENEIEAKLNRDRQEYVLELQSKLASLKWDAKKQKWYFIKFQSFCKTDEDFDGNSIYVLAEVGLIEYSLESGITNTYNEFIKPEVIPPGYTAACRDNSKQFHQIPLDYDKAKANYGEIYKKIIEFIKPTKENYYYTPVFCLNSDLEETRYGLQYLKSKAYDARSTTFKIIDLESLVTGIAALKCHEISNNSATELLTAYNFDYSSETRCEFHEEIGTKYCSLGFVKRAAYLISDNLCPLFDIKPEAGIHLPVEKLTGVAVQLDSHEFRTFSKQRHNESRTKRYGENNYNYNPITYDIRYESSTTSIKSTFSSKVNFDNNNNTNNNGIKSANQGRIKVADMLISTITASKSQSDGFTMNNNSENQKPPQSENPRQQNRCNNDNDTSSVITNTNLDDTNNDSIYANEDDDDNQSGWHSVSSRSSRSNLAGAGRSRLAAIKRY